MKKTSAKPNVMDQVRGRFEQSGLSLHDLGLKMGYAPQTARQAAWQFMKGEDPRLSMLRRFADAMDFDVKELL
jgi:transcriptional regulator with XRE-family HTH domain